MKIGALDIGDVWTGTALSDELCMFARPYKTVESTHLDDFLSSLFSQEPVEVMVVGHPKTLKGTQSEQTKKVEDSFALLQKKFPSISWILWDERFSSKQADQLKKATTKEQKIHAHSIAAAFILSSYLEYRYNQQNI